MNHTFLILTHKPIEHIFYYAELNKEIFFYVHVDKKIDINKIKKESKYGNVVFLNDQDRVDVSWAGFSMIQATINLLNFALSNCNKNEYFHLISGDDVLLNDRVNWCDSRIFIECRESSEHRYRMRFNTPHADTKYQRTLLGKFITQIFKKIDLLLPTNEKFYFGSQWFSIRRNELETLMNSITEEDFKYFRKKLCPDEHFFQYLIIKNNLLGSVSNEGNKRFIKFDSNFQHGSSPIFLSLEQLVDAKNQKYWFARKVKFSTINAFYKFNK